MTLNTLQQDLVIGTLLGDGNLQTFSETVGTWRYRALHKQEHKDYVFHKFGILKPFCGLGTLPAYGSTYDLRTGKTYERWYFNTLTDPVFKPYADLFYTYNPSINKWVKEVPSNIETMLTPRALAYFYMDDGALKWKNHSDAMRICTENFNKQSIQYLQDSLKNKFGITTTLEKKKLADGRIGERLYIPTKQSASFREIIKPHLVDVMKYKVSDGNKGHL